VGVRSTNGSVECEVWAIDIDQEVPRCATRAVSPEETSRARRLTSEQATKRFLRSRAALRTILGQKLGVRPDAVQLKLGAAGKPSLHGEPTVTFNISHSGRVLVIAVAERVPLGVDVEMLSVRNDLLRLAAHWFHPQETRAIAALAPSARERGVLALWCAKEALIKALGLPLAEHLQDVELILRTPATATVLRSPGPRPRTWSLRPLQVGSALAVGMLAAPTPELRIRGRLLGGGWESLPVHA
jgi:4'-phosphopantetheinyl transferase